MKTKAIFRISQGEVFALFPQLAGDMNPATCMSYAHMGQHSSADLALCSRRFRLATRKECAPLAKELRRIGYRLTIAKRATQKDYAMRKEQVSRT